jgi:hypothetical protein
MIQTIGQQLFFLFVHADIGFELKGCLYAKVPKSGGRLPEGAENYRLL